MKYIKPSVYALRRIPRGADVIVSHRAYGIVKGKIIGVCGCDLIIESESPIYFGMIEWISYYVSLESYCSKWDENFIILLDTMCEHYSVFYSGRIFDWDNKKGWISKIKN